MAGFICIARIIIFDVEKALLRAVLTPVFHFQKLFDERESEIGGKGARDETSLVFHNPTVLCAQMLLFVTKAAQKLLQKTIHFYYPLHLLDLKQKHANCKIKLRISRHFVQFWGVAK